nr:hypothetical protein [Propionibacterium sp.]
MPGDQHRVDVDHALQSHIGQERELPIERMKRGGQVAAIDPLDPQRRDGLFGLFSGGRQFLGPCGSEPHDSRPVGVVAVVVLPLVAGRRVVEQSPVLRGPGMGDLRSAH